MMYVTFESSSEFSYFFHVKENSRNFSGRIERSLKKLIGVELISFRNWNIYIYTFLDYNILFNHLRVKILTFFHIKRENSRGNFSERIEQSPLFSVSQEIDC